MVADKLGTADYDAVTVVHSETSTGALNPIEELAPVVHDAGDVVLLVDSVTGLAGAPVESDAWKLDFVLAGSQKALALPPGMALGVAQPSALERAGRTTNRGTYFDFLDFEKNAEKHPTPNTPPLSLLYALQAQLECIDREGVTQRWQRHQDMARRTWQWVDAMNQRGVALEVLAPPGGRSPTVTCIMLPDGRTGPELTAAMLDRGFTIGGGYGKLKDRAFRIGHMGDHTLEQLESLLGHLEEALLK
jgi:aspartate aminotransferase-like enzyme